MHLTEETHRFCAWRAGHGVQSARGGLAEEEEPTFVLPDQEGPDVAVVASTQARARQTCPCVMSQFPSSFPQVLIAFL